MRICGRPETKQNSLKIKQRGYSKKIPILRNKPNITKDRTMSLNIKYNAIINSSTSLNIDK